MQLCMHACIHTYIHTYIHTHIRTFLMGAVALYRWGKAEIAFPGSQRWVGLVVYKCAVLCSAVYGPSATERTLGTICEKKGVSSRFQVSIFSLCNLGC